MYNLSLDPVVSNYVCKYTCHNMNIEKQGGNLLALVGNHASDRMICAVYRVSHVRQGFSIDCVDTHSHACIHTLISCIFTCAHTYTHCGIDAVLIVQLLPRYVSTYVYCQIPSLSCCYCPERTLNEHVEIDMEYIQYIQYMKNMNKMKNMQNIPGFYSGENIWRSSETALVDITYMYIQPES